MNFQKLLFHLKTVIESQVMNTTSKNPYKTKVYISFNLPSSKYDPESYRKTIYYLIYSSHDCQYLNTICFPTSVHELFTFQSTIFTLHNIVNALQ